MVVFQGGLFFGDYTTQIYVLYIICIGIDYFINYEIRIPFLNNQYSMESKGPVSFFRGSSEIENMLTLDIQANTS